MGATIRLVSSLVPAVLLAFIVGCGEDEQPADQTQNLSEDAPRVVLYTSADDYLLDEVVAAYEAQTGTRVLVVGDTEATKTVGLYQRILSERESPRADVWWSSEPFYTIRLAKQDIFDPYASESAERSFPGGWPDAYRGEGGLWYGFANRARVIAYDTRKYDAPEVPRLLRELVEPEWEGKVGMARPTFGTTVGHIAALIHLWGEEPTRQWLELMEANGLRLYDGNSSVVRAIASGEIEIGLTDTDDVWAAQAQGLPVGLVYESSESPEGATLTPGQIAPLSGFGSLTIPNTVALVASGPNPDAGKRLVDFLISEGNERRIMASDSRNVPVRPRAAEELFQTHPESRIEPSAGVDLEAVAGEIERAQNLVREVFGL